MHSPAEYFHVGLANDAGYLTDRYYVVPDGQNPARMENAITAKVCSEFDEGTSFSSESVSRTSAKRAIILHNALTLMATLRTGFTEHDAWTRSISIENVTINNT